MAALANLYSKIAENAAGSQGERPPRTGQSGQVDSPSAAARQAASLCRAITPRPFANEDVFFYVKRIDNSGVVRAADPASRGSAWKLIGSVSAASLLVVGILLPGAYGLMAGYQIQSLKEQSKQLQAEQGALDVEQAKVITPARMRELVQEQQFTDPALQRTVYLPSIEETGNGPALAANQTSETSKPRAAR